MATPEEIAETLRLLGLTGDETPKDVLETMKILGVKVAPSGVKARGEVPAKGEEAKRVYTPAEKKEAESRGFSSAVISGMPIVGPLENIGRAAAKAIPGMGGEKADTFGDRFKKNFETQMGGEKLYNEEHPIAAPVGNLLGGVVATAPVAATRLGGAMLGTYGPTWGSRALTGAAGSGVMSGADAALRGENPLTSAGIGAVAGFAGPTLAEGFRAGTRGIANAIWPPTGALRGVPAPAVNRLIQAFEGETPASIAAARQRMGPAGFAGDTNNATTDLMGGIADTPGPGKELVREAYRNRAAGQRDRVEDSITQALGPRINLANVTRQEKTDRADAARPLYEAWENTRVTPTDRLKKLTLELEDEGILKEANRLLKAEGKETYEKHFTPGNRNEWPTAEAWDYAKQAIDGKIKGALREGDANSVRVYTKLKKRITDAIDNHPDPRVAGVWRQAREAWANPTGILNARKMGADLWDGKTRTDELAYVLTDFSGPERAAFRQGAREELAQMIDASRRGDTTVRNKLLAPANQEKIFWISPNGRPNAQRLIHTLESEEYLAGQHTNVRGGSQTTPKKERVDALKPNPLPEYNPDFTKPLSLIPNTLMQQLRPSHILDAWRGVHHANSNNRLAQLLLTPEPQMDDLVRAIQAEGARRAGRDARIGPTTNALTALVSGAGNTTARRQYLPVQ